MVVNRKVTGKASSMPVGIGIGLAISLLVTLTGCAVVAGLIHGEYIREETIGYGAMTVLLLSSFFGALTASWLIRHRRLLVCMAVGVLFFGTLLLINGLMFGGAVSGAGVTALLILGGSACAALLTTRGEGKTKHKYKKVRNG